MAKITLEYTKYTKSRLATVFSFLGELLFKLCIAPGIIGFGVSVVGVVFSGFTDGERWRNLLIFLIVAVLGLVFGLGLKLLFERLAAWVAKGKNQ